MTHW